MSKLNIYIKSHLKIFQCICRMEMFLDLYKNWFTLSGRLTEVNLSL